MTKLFLLALLAPSASAEPIRPPSEDIKPGVFIDINRSGFEQIEGIARTLLPPTVPIDTSGFVQGGGFDAGLFGLDYEFGVQNLYVIPEIEDISVTPRNDKTCRMTRDANGYLDVDVDMRVSLNRFDDPGYAYITVDGSLFFGLISGSVLSESCNIVVDRKPASANIDIAIGQPQNPITCLFEQVAPNDCPLDVIGAECPCVVPAVEIGELEWDLDIQNINDLDLNCTGFISLILDIADVFNIDPVEILLESFRPSIDQTIDDALADLQPTLDEALGGLNIETQLDLLGTQLDVAICPTDLFVDERGLRIELGAAMDGPALPDPCVSRFDPGGSLVTVPPTGERYPLLGMPGITFDAQAGAMVDDDLANVALYQLWRAGLLCQSISADNSPIDLPIALDTSLLNLLSGQAFADLFDSAKPLLMETRPEKPPVFRMITQGTEIGVVEVEDFGIDLYAELDGRMARMVGLDVALQAGITAGFDSTTGQLNAVVDIDPSAIDPKVVFNDLKPDADAQIESGFSSIVDTVVGPLLGDLLAPFTFDLPTFAGIGVQTAVVAAAGPGGDWFGAFGTVGPVGYAGPAQGCDLLGGGAAGGCGGAGCTQGGVPGRAALLLFPLVVAWFRRRDVRGA